MKATFWPMMLPILGIGLIVVGVRTIISGSLRLQSNLWHENPVHIAGDGAKWLGVGTVALGALLITVFILSRSETNSRTRWEDFE
ncbi:MAG: hypothetical protein ABL949_12050 [Fimbriimonadaceae bacterium]